MACSSLGNGCHAMVVWNGCHAIEVLVAQTLPMFQDEHSIKSREPAFMSQARAKVVQLFGNHISFKDYDFEAIEWKYVSCCIGSTLICFHILRIELL